MKPLFTPFAAGIPEGQAQTQSSEISSREIGRFSHNLSFYKMEKRFIKAIAMAVLLIFAIVMQTHAQGDVNLTGTSTQNYLPKWVDVTVPPYTINNSQINDNGTAASTGGIGINTTFQWNNTYNTMYVPSATSTAENCFMLSTSDALTNSSGAGDYFRIQNLTSVDGIFATCLQGHIESSQTASPDKVPLYLIGSVSSAEDGSGNTTPVMAFDARQTSAAIANRDLFTWNNYGTSLMTMDKNGNLGIGTSAPAAVLHASVLTI